MRKKRTICIIMILTMCVALAASCGGATPSSQSDAPSGVLSALPPEAANNPGTANTTLPPAPPPRKDVKYADEITVIIDNNKIAILDPGNPANSTGTTRWAFRLIYDGLVRLNNYTLQYEPMLATSWETDDYQTFVFHLRDDVYFHNGEHFTAADVVYTIERGQALVGTQASDRWTLVDSMNIIDDYTLELTLKRAYVDFIPDITSSHCGILNKKAIEADPEKGPWIGTGPWIVTDFVSNEYSTYAVNKNYWGEVPVTKKLTLKYVAEESARVMMLENGEVQVSAGINSADYGFLMANPDLQVFHYIVSNVCYLGFNTNDPITGDVNFRKAVAHAIKRDDMVLAARNGLAEAPLHGAFWGYTTEFKNTDIPLMPYDLEKAREYLNNSTYNGETVEIVAALPEFIINAQVIQQNLSVIGINCSVYETDAPGMASYATFADNKAQMICFVGAWNPPASSVRSFLYPGSNYNKASYVNDTVTELLDKASTILDPAGREAVYKEIQEIVERDSPYLNLFYMTQIVAALKGVEGIEFSGSDDNVFRYVRMVIE